MANLDETCRDAGEWTLTNSATLDVSASRGGAISDKGILVGYHEAGNGIARNTHAVTVTSGHSYSLNFWAANAEQAGSKIDVYAGASASAMVLVGRIALPFDDPAGWYACSVPIRATGSGMFVAFTCSGDEHDEGFAGQGFFVDDVQIALVPARTAIWTNPHAINLSSPPSPLPAGWVGPGVRIEVELAADGGPVDPSVAALLSTDDFAQE
jgi:hypothetical protein